MGSAKYTFKNKELELHITIGKAFFLKTEFGINLLNLFEEGNMENLLATLALNDEKVIDIWWYHLEKEGFTDRAECIDSLTRDNLTEFKNAFWNSIVNFSDPTARETLVNVKKRLPELLKLQVDNSINQALKSLNESSKT